MSQHLRRKHQANIQIRKQVDEYVQKLIITCNFKDYNFKTVPLPPDGLAPQPVLPILDGFLCQDCEYRSKNRKAVREHVNKEHNKKRVKDNLIFSNIRLQSWFTEGKERYWIVNESREEMQRDRSRDINKDASRGRGSGIGSTNEEIKAAVEKWSEEAKERRLVLSQKPAAVEISPWLRYTGWIAVLSASQHGLVKTYEFTRPPDVEETQLIRVLEAWDRIFTRCLDTLEAVDHKDVLKWWQSPKNEVTSQHPFELPQNNCNLIKYSRRWQSFLCYVMRTSPEDSWKDKSETGVKYNQRQWECVDEIRSLLEGEEEEKDVEKDGEAMAVAVAKRDAKLITAVMDLIVNVVTQDTSKLSLYDSPLLHYLAVCGVNPTTKSFHTAFTYTPILAQVLWTVRLIMLEIALPLQAWEELKLHDRTRVGSVARRVHTIREKHLCEGSFSPASSILTLLARGKALNKDHWSESNIYWSDDRQTVFYKGVPVAVAKIRSMCQALIQELQEILHELLFHQAVPDVPLAEVVDSTGSGQSFRQDNYCFVDHPANVQFCKVSWEFLYKRMLQDKPEWRLVKASSSGSGSGTHQWVDFRKSGYLNRERQFLQKLMVAMHVTGGQPARGPEIGSIKVVNNIFSARGIYVINGRAVFVTTYDKAQKRRGKTEYILRYLPDTISQILVKYLIYILPFSRVVGQRESDYLFADEHGPWAGEQLSRAVAVATTKHLGVRLTVCGWRQVAIAIANEHLGRVGKMWEQDDQDEDEEAVADAGDEAEEELNIFEHILVRQSAHGHRVASRHYAINGAFLNTLGPALIAAYSQASRAWHVLLELKSDGVKEAAVAVAAKKKGKHGRKASQQLQPAVVKRGQRNQQRKDDQQSIRSQSPVTREAVAVVVAQRRAKKGLEKIYGVDAKPQSEGQATALELVHRAAAPDATTIIVLPTGSGKTALFFSVAALVVRQAVVVVVPFAALVDDIVARAWASGLSCQEWQGKESLVTTPQLIVVSADKAVTSDFLHHAKGLELDGQLAHIFLDECHVAITDTSYRKRLRQLHQLRHCHCPFTCLTATLLVPLEPVLRANLLLHDATLFRRSTMRPTIQYDVLAIESAPSEFAVTFVQTLPLPPSRRGIIYVRSYTTGDVISSKLRCLFYKAHADEKAAILNQWASGSGSGGWIVATGALGTGIDIQGVTYIVHVDRPYGLTSFMQQSGRGGRGGEESKSFVIIRSGGGRRRHAALVTAYTVEDKDEEALSEFLSTQSCRRAVLAQYMDGVSTGAECVRSGSVLCDQCRRHNDGSRVSNAHGGGSGNTGSQAIAQAYLERATQDEATTRFLDTLKRHCIYCRLMLVDGDEEVDIHSHAECPEAKSRGCELGAYRRWRRQLKLAPRGQCYQCGLPQSLCAAVEQGGQCEYYHVLLPGIFILHQCRVLEPMCKAVGFQGEYGSEGWQWQWMNEQSDQQFGERILNWMLVWEEVRRQYYCVKGEE